MPSYECRGKKKLWSVRFDITQNGQTITKRLSGFPTKKESQKAYMDFLLKYQEEQKLLQPSKSILERKFEDVYEEYKNYKKTKVKDSSFYEINRCFNTLILPTFKGMKIKEITKTHILRWQESLENYSFMYKKKLRMNLHSFYKYLYYYYDVDNVVARVEPFKNKNEHKEMQFWTLDEFDKFINTFNDNEDLTLKTFYNLLYYTGCRFGEATALNFKDIDFKEKKLNITKNITLKVYDKKENQSYNVTSTKNYTSNRKILLPDILLNELRKYIEKNPGIKNCEFLFGGNRPIDDQLVYRMKNKHCEIANIKNIRIHDFRHSHTSLLIQNGANIVLIAKRLGHKNTQQTLNTYAHLFPNTENELIELLNNIKKIG